MAMLTCSLKRQISALQRDKRYTDMQKDIFETISKILPPNASLRPSQAASSIDKLFPKPQPADQSISDWERDAEDFLWTFWNALIDIVQAVPYQHFGHVEIIELVDRLSHYSRGTVTIWGDEHRLWADLPLLGPCMRERWLPPQLNHAKPDKEVLQKWKSLNSFAARAYGKGIVQWRNFAVWELRAALEEDFDNAAALEYHMAIVKEWILHAGNRIFEDARTTCNDDSKVLKSGSLYNGSPGLNTERWNFWKERLAEIARRTSGEISSGADGIVWLMEHPAA